MWTLSERAVAIRSKEQARYNEHLKAQKRDPLNEYELDLRMFALLPFAHPCRWEFLIRCWNHQWPTHMVVEAGDLKNYWLIRMARDFCRRKRLGLLGCASAGKSFALAAYTYTFWKSQPFNTSIYLSTTSAQPARPTCSRLTRSGSVGASGTHGGARPSAIMGWAGRGENTRRRTPFSRACWSG